jgi:hypothetical protein
MKNKNKATYILENKKEAEASLYNKQSLNVKVTITKIDNLIE